MRKLLVYHNGAFQQDLPDDAIDGLLDIPDALVWLDLQDPDEGDIALLGREFGFHPLAIEDATRPHERPKVDAYQHSLLRIADRIGAGEGEPTAGELPGYYFVVFYSASFDGSGDRLDLQPVNLFIGSNYLVTVHPGATHHVSETQARWQAGSGSVGPQIGSLVHAFLDSIVDDYFPVMDQVAERVEDLEGDIFDHFRHETIETIFGLKKDLLALRRAVAPERDVLNVLLRRDLAFFTPTDTAYLQDVYDHIVRVTDNIDTYRDLLSSALDSYLSVQSNNLNEVMKVLTIASIILMSCALISGIYGMNFNFMPELRWRLGYPFALLLMVIISSGLIVYFRRKRWL